jgi:hypothetical protein
MLFGLRMWLWCRRGMLGGGVVEAASGNKMGIIWRGVIIMRLNYQIVSIGSIGCAAGCRSMSYPGDVPLPQSN